MKKRIIGFGIKLAVTMIVGAALYIGFRLLTKDNTPEIHGQTPAMQAAKHVSELKIIIGDINVSFDGSPNDTYNFTQLLQFLKQRTDLIAKIEVNSLPKDQRDLYQSILDNQKTFLSTYTAASEQYSKVLEYYPERDLYGTGISEDIAKGRANEAVANLEKISKNINYLPASDAISNVISCLEIAAKSYSEDSCISQYIKLRQAAIEHISSVIDSEDGKNLQKALDDFLAA